MSRPYQVKTQPRRRQRRFAGRLLPLLWVKVAGCKGTLGVARDPHSITLYVEAASDLGRRLVNDEEARKRVTDEAFPDNVLMKDWLYF